GPDGVHVLGDGARARHHPQARLGDGRGATGGDRSDLGHAVLFRGGATAGPAELRKISTSRVPNCLNDGLRTCGAQGPAPSRRRIPRDNTNTWSTANAPGRRGAPRPATVPGTARATQASPPAP